MKNYYYLCTLLLLLGAATASAQWTSKDFRKLKGITGNWEAKRGEGYTQEKWTRLNDTTFSGNAYNIDRGVSILDERIRIVYTNQEIHYIVTISYQNKGLPVTFKLASVKDDCYTFENKEHDFPQQIIYCLKNSKHMDVTVSGPGQEGTRSMEFHFTKQ